MSKVMLIEDDPVMLTLLQTLLEYEGFQTAQLNGEGSTEEILSRIRGDKPELILLDVNLGQVNGLDLLRKLRKDDELKSIRVLVSSGMELGPESFGDGADGFILKPYMPDELVGRIRDTLRVGE
jgi:two-component system, OmpR family, response regulator ArlR